MPDSIIILPGQAPKAQSGAFGHVPGGTLGLVEQAALQAFVEEVKGDFIFQILGPETRRQLARDYDAQIPIRFSTPQVQRFRLNTAGGADASLEALLLGLRATPAVSAFLDAEGLRLTLSDDNQMFRVAKP